VSMVRSRALMHLVPVALLLGVYNTPLAARTPVSETAPRQLVAAPRQPALAVPRALMHRAAVHVIVEMNDASPAGVLLGGSSQLQNLLTGVRGHLLDVLRAAHARDVYAFHLVPAIAATVAGTDLPGLLAQPGVRAIVLDQWHHLLPAPAVASRGVLHTPARAVSARSGSGGVTPSAPRPSV